MRNDDGTVGGIAFFIVYSLIGCAIFLVLSPIFDTSIAEENRQIEEAASGDSIIPATQERADAMNTIAIFWRAFLIFIVLIPGGIYLWITAMREKSGYT